MFPATPPVHDISRTKLKTLAAWIRDELDPLIARDGPEALRSDDVVMLHEMLTMIRHNPNISALDLRSSGIHRAIQAIAGTTTPWPSRLCDDCNKIIALWTSKFGPLNALHPFLYGRGGRLEGVANVNDYTRNSLLKKWSGAGHQQTDPKQTHRAGNLGFRAGDWWINALFAHHAGIIGIDALDGGTTFDNNGAYALVLKDSSELSTESDCRFSYRMKQSDKGKYRLTAATPGSREPIRVLRSHNIGSKWGPEVGIRYDGLYKVAGWSICTAKATDAQVKLGEIFFDVQFERIDEVPMEDVIRRPTAYEVDDYMEYKRLRKLNRAVQAHNLDSGDTPVTMDIVGRAAPLIQPSHYLTTPPPSIMAPKLSPDISRKAVFWDPQWNVNPEPVSAQSDTISPRTLIEPNSFDLMPKAKNSISAAVMHLTQPEKRTPLLTPSGPSATSIRTSDKMSPVAALSNASSMLSGASTPKSMKEVTPWMEYDPGMNAPTDSKPTIVRKNLSRKTSTIRSTTKKPGMAGSSQHMNSSRQVSRQSTSQSEDMGQLQQQPSATSTLHRHKQTSREPTVRRNQNPMARLFDGPAFDEGAEDYFGNAVYVPDTDSVGFLSPSRHRGRRSASPSGTIRVQSSTPIKSLSSESLERLERRKAIAKSKDSLARKGISTCKAPAAGAGLASLELNESGPFSEMGERAFIAARAEVEGSTKFSRLVKDKPIQGKEIKVAFSDPFPRETPASPPTSRRGRRKRSSGVAPDEVG